jgi:hypothetical protein
VIDPKVRATLSTCGGVLLIPTTTCAHCGLVADQETAACWELDDDGDRMCRACAKKATDK